MIWNLSSQSKKNPLIFWATEPWLPYEFKCYSLLVLLYKMTPASWLITCIQNLVSVWVVSMCWGANWIFVLSPQSVQCQTGRLVADGVGCEIRLALTHVMRLHQSEVAVGESSSEISSMGISLAMRRSRFAYVCNQLSFRHCLFHLRGRAINAPPPS